MKFFQWKNFKAITIGTICVIVLVAVLTLPWLLPARVTLSNERPVVGITAVLDDAPAGTAAGPAPVYGYRILAVYPHDPSAYTQGLLYHEGRLYESTGRYGESSLREVELETGRVLRRQPLERKYFAEGLALWEERLFLLTWREGIAYVFDRGRFRFREKFSYAGEGWGITHDGRRLIMSDGSATLTFRDPETFAERGRLTVHDGGRPVKYLNELEGVRGRILANVFRTDRIAIIRPDREQIEGWIDLGGLPARRFRWQKVEMLNGIAWDAERDRLFVTGKLWPRLFEIVLTPPEPEK